MKKSLFYAGLDVGKQFLPKDLGGYCNQPFLLKDELFNAVTSIHCGIDFIVFQKLSDNFTWFIIGEGIPAACEIFSSSLQVSQVAFSSNALVGLSGNNGRLYRVKFSLDLKYGELNWNQERIDLPDSSIQIKQIVTNSKSAFALDDQSGIYEVGESRLTLKWRLSHTEVTKLCCGFGHFVALTDTGGVYSWGSGGRGELGHMDGDHVMTNCEDPTRIEFFDDLPCIVRDICCGGWHTLALTSDGDSYSWGWNESGQLGHSGDKISPAGGIPYPVDIGSGDDPVALISCGGRHSIAALKSGQILAWGLNKYGQLGVGDLQNKLEPTVVKGCRNCKELIGTRWGTIFVSD